jgi:hypothetical protein
MGARIFSIITSSAILAFSNLAQATCSPILAEHIASVQRIVDSLRPDKPGQVRVFASDGAEYTAGNVLWMKGQLHAVEHACAQGDEISAASSLRGVSGLLNSHDSLVKQSRD